MFHYLTARDPGIAKKPTSEEVAEAYTLISADEPLLALNSHLVAPKAKTNLCEVVISLLSPSALPSSTSRAIHSRYIIRYSAVSTRARLDSIVLPRSL